MKKKNSGIVEVAENATVTTEAGKASSCNSLNISIHFILFQLVLQYSLQWRLFLFFFSFSNNYIDNRQYSEARSSD